MRISIICFSLTGYMTAEDLQKDLQGKGYTAEIYKKSKYLDDSIAEEAISTVHIVLHAGNLFCTPWASDKEGSCNNS